MLATTYAVGVELANGVVKGLTGRMVRVKVDLVTIPNLPTKNVVARRRAAARTT